MTRFPITNSLFFPHRLATYLLSKPRVLPLLCDEVCWAFLEMCQEVFPDQFVHRENDGAGQGDQGPVTKVHPGNGWLKATRFSKALTALFSINKIPLHSVSMKCYFLYDIVWDSYVEIFVQYPDQGKRNSSFMFTVITLSLAQGDPWSVWWVVRKARWFDSLFSWPCPKPSGRETGLLSDLKQCQTFLFRSGLVWNIFQSIYQLKWFLLFPDPNGKRLT